MAVSIPFLRALMLLIHECLPDKVLINEGVTIEHMNGFITRQIQGVKCGFIEIDFSKFDKSQDDFCLEC